MSYFAKVIRKYKRMRYGFDQPSEFCLALIDDLYRWKRRHRFCREFIKNDCISIKDVRLPLLDGEHKKVFFRYVFEETFGAYLYMNDRYDEDMIDLYRLIVREEPYGFQNAEIDVTVKTGDTVLDVGSWIGDFAAYASAKGASVYAFEPSEAAFGYLSQTAKLNPGIVPIKKGVSNETGCKTFLDGAAHTEDGRILGPEIAEHKVLSPNETPAVIKTITVDEFVKQNHLPKVNFIKADIEGEERHMLEGAQETLKYFAPKLALCTYHLPDDPEVMSALIRQANPAYHIIQKCRKLYAAVPTGR